MSQEAANQLVASISLDRFSRYLQAAGGDRQLAIALYRWNIACSASFYGPLQSLEVTLRNGLHEALTRRFGQADWWDHPSLLLADIHRAAVADARTSVPAATLTVRVRAVTDWPIVITWSSLRVFELFSQSLT